MIKQNKNDLFRLAAVLYADNNYEVSTQVIHRKILDSALLDYENDDLTIHTIIDHIDTKYSIIISENEILSIIKKYPTSFLTNSNTICLSPKRKSVLNKKIQNNNIEYFINEFLIENENKKIAKKTIYDFLYHMFSVNTSSFQKLIDKEKDISSLISLQDFNYKQEEINYINDFLNWDNPDKNKAIFDISSYALEFCLLTNKKGNSNFKLNNLKNKNFYLDTNVIYRAIGINGLDRKKRTLTFLKKFKEAGEHLSITRITDIEFQNSIKFYIDKLRKIHNPKASSKIFLEFRSLKDINSFYHNWRKTKINSNLDLFESYVINEYKTLLEFLKIDIDFKKPYDAEEEETKEYLNDLYSSLNNSKPIERQNYYQSTLNDVENILWIEKKREGKVENIFDTSYFFISSDNLLRKWDYYRGYDTPIVLLPSQWMSILLRYFDRTKDDYKSFVSFLNLNSNEKVIEGEKLNIILSGISEMTSDVEQQRFLVSNLIEKDFKDVINLKSSNEEILKQSKLYAKSELEKSVLLLSEKVEKLEKEKENKETIIGATIKTAKDKKETNKLLIEELTERKTENEELAKKYTELKINEEIRKWRRPLWLLIPLGLFIIYFYMSIFISNDYDFGKQTLDFIDTRASEALKNFLNALFYAPIGGLIAILIYTYKKLDKEYVKKKRIEIVKENENTTKYIR